MRGRGRGKEEEEEAWRKGSLKRNGEGAGGDCFCE